MPAGQTQQEEKEGNTSSEREKKTVRLDVDGQFERRN